MKNTELYSVQITTAKGDHWLGLFSDWPEGFEIVEALRVDKRVAVASVEPDIEYDPTRKAYALEHGKWKRLQDVVKFAEIRKDPMRRRAACEVATPMSHTPLGEIVISRQRVFRNQSVNLETL